MKKEQWKTKLNKNTLFFEIAKWSVAKGVNKIYLNQPTRSEKEPRDQARSTTSKSNPIVKCLYPNRGGNAIRVKSGKNHLRLESMRKPSCFCLLRRCWKNHQRCSGNTKTSLELSPRLKNCSLELLPPLQHHNQGIKAF